MADACALQGIADSIEALASRKYDAGAISPFVSIEDL